MTIHETAQLNPASPGQILDLASKIAHYFNGKADADVVQDLISDAEPLLSVMRPVLMPAQNSFVAKKVEEWRDFYREEFGIELGDVEIPAKPRGFNRLIVVAQGVTIQQVYDKCAEKFNCWKYTNSNLDDVVTVNDRTNNVRAYAVWVRDRVEADKEFKNKSANDLKAIKHQGITLLERLLLELKYYKETGKHLDIENWTLCSGSRGSDGSVPYVDWGSDRSRLRVDWCTPGSARDGLRSREVAS